MDGSYDVFPRWARWARIYEREFPNHRGKRSALRALYRMRARSGRPFVWRMKNGALLAISPAEALAPHAIGWRCFQDGIWEPHVEQTLRRLLRPGDVAYDIGANLGYFSAVMAQAVGTSGCVVAFEPIQETFARLELCRNLNGFSQLRPLRVAVGSATGTRAMRFDPRMSGEASFYAKPGSGSEPEVDVPFCSLDDLVESHRLLPPALIKVDVEGHEFAVVGGARLILQQHRPALVFELNEAMSRQAGWTASDLGVRLRELAPYEFFLLGTGDPQPVDLAQLDLPKGVYVDILAIAEDKRSSGLAG